MDINKLSDRLKEYVHQQVRKTVSEAAEGIMSAEQADTEITNLIDSLLDFQKQVKPQVSSDPDLEAALTSRINTSVAALSQLKKKLSVAVSKKKIDQAKDIEPKDVKKPVPKREPEIEPEEEPEEK